MKLYIVTIIFFYSCYSISGELTTQAPSIDKICRSLNESCDKCVSNPKCLYCLSDELCKPYPTGKVFPNSDDCKPDMGKARWATCAINFKALLISMGVIAGLIIFVLPLVIYCCCCRSGGSAKAARRIQREEDKWSREDSARQERHSARRADREQMYDDIRQKYGLSRNGQPPYSRMQENA